MIIYFPKSFDYNNVNNWAKNHFAPNSKFAKYHWKDWNGERWMITFNKLVNVFSNV